MAPERLPPGAGGEPAGALPRGHPGGRDRRVRRHLADGRRGARDDVRRPSPLPAASHRGAPAPVPARRRRRPSRARGDSRGAALEPRRASAVREVRVPAGRDPAALLQRQPGGRADHDDGAARRARHAGPRLPAPRRARRGPGAERPPGRRGRPRRRGRPAALGWPVVSGPLLLAVESSCDETGVALVEDGRRIHANVVASQVALHAPTGGIVPEVAARAHLRWIVPALDQAMTTAGVTMDDVDAVAVAYGPGLAGSLLVGINFAKTIAWAHGKPLVPVNHLEGHVYAGWLLDQGEEPRDAPPFPLVALVVSGGHTFLVEMRDHLDYRLLGTTVDDAAGEAFDKVGRLLGLGYPGGPAISRAAEAAVAHDRVFPRAWLPETYDLSFSGLKTAARRIVARARSDEGLPADEREGGSLGDGTVAELAWGFQDSVVDVLATKTIRAAEAVGARGIVLGGGVAANAALRARIAGEAEARGIAMVIPRPGLCTDNGAMIGAAGARRLAAGVRAGLDLDARPSLPLAR